GAPRLENNTGAPSLPQSVAAARDAAPGLGGAAPAALLFWGRPGAVAVPPRPAPLPGVTMSTVSQVGLTTTKAPFIEQARAGGETYIDQPYDLYSEENHEAWRRLYARMEDRWRRYANAHFLQGIDNLCLDPARVPRLDDVNRFLSPLTGFKARAVSGYVPAYLFFDRLRHREFPKI